MSYSSTPTLNPQSWSSHIFCPKCYSKALKEQEKWKYQGSLEWWKKAALTTYHPTATALITLGTCLTETALILLITQPKRNKQK